MSLLPRPPEELLAQTPPAVVAYLGALEARLVEQDARIVALEVRLRQDSSTSSRPPSSDPPGTQAQRRAPLPPAGGTGEPRQRGGQPGHPGRHRSLVDEDRVDRVVVVTPPACRGCGTELGLEAAPGDPSDERVQVVELPPVRAEVTEYRLAARRCGGCGVVTRAARPAAAGGGSFGPRLQAVGALLVGRYRLSRREAVACLAELGEVELSLGAVAHLEQATSTALEPVVAGVATAVQQAAAANLDETGWWQGHRRAWLWTMVTEALTLFRLDPSRSSAVVRELLGPKWAGIVGSDRYSAYRWLPLEQRQLCWAHLVREFRKLATYNQHQAPLGERLLDLSTRIFAIWYRFRAAAIDRPTLLVELAPLQAELRRALEDGLAPPHAVVAGALCGNLLDCWPALWTFAHVDGVEPTNNAAERALRPAVLWRKGSFGTQSDHGSRFVERLLTVAASCKQQGRGLLDFLVQAITASRLGLPPPSLVPVATP
ncbi:MAG TPA: IS66 family transposase [Mycobacteriales bacterium]|nr:IS66 family transposase [Mycobacteriales bacterium]